MARWRSAVIAAVAVGALAPSAATALVTGPPKPKAKPKPKPAKPRVSVWRVKTTAISLIVDFHGDQAAGCAQHGFCDTAGTTTLRLPAGSGFMSSVSGPGFTLVTGVLSSRARLDANVTTAGAAAACTDRQRPPFVYFGISPGSSFVFGSSALPAGSGSALSDSFANRCSGPLADDLAQGLPRAHLPRFLRMHTFKVVLDQSQAFTGGGFAGTVTATGTLRFRRLATSAANSF